MTRGAVGCVSCVYACGIQTLGWGGGIGGGSIGFLDHCKFYSKCYLLSCRVSSFDALCEYGGISFVGGGLS